MTKMQGVEFKYNGIEIAVRNFEEAVDRYYREMKVDPSNEEKLKKKIRTQLQNEIEHEIEEHVEALQYGEVEEVDGVIDIAFDNDTYGGNSDYRSFELHYTIEQNWKGEYKKVTVDYSSQL